MSWILFSVLAALTWAIVNTVDKYILTKWVKKPIVPVMILGIVSLIASGVIYFVHGFAKISYLYIFLAALAGIFWALSNVFYFRAAKIEEISRVVPLYYLTPLFVLILAAFFLGEIFTPAKYLGIFLLISGAFLISLKGSLKFNFGKALWLMILASLVLAIYIVITKYLLNFTDFWTIFGYGRIGAFIALIPLFWLRFPDLKSTVKKHGKKVVGIIATNESLNLVGVLMTVIAMSVGFATLVNALSSIQPFFVLFFAVILSIFYPKILKEEIKKSTVFLKLLAIILMFGGALLIT